MIFAAAFPIGPLAVMFANYLDLYFDSKRLMNVMRRPIARRAEDIATWQPILSFINIVAVVSNSFLIAFTSKVCGG
jgi:hypothetical protein